MSSETKIQDRYSLKVGNRKFVFESVPLTKGAIGNWGISQLTMKNMMKSVCVELLSNKEEILNFEELEFLAEAAQLRMNEVAALIGVDKSLISKWKNGQNKIQYLQSYCLKDKLVGPIFGEEDQRNFDATARAKAWREKCGCPVPRQMQAS